MSGLIAIGTEHWRVRLEDHVYTSTSKRWIERFCLNVRWNSSQSICWFTLARSKSSNSRRNCEWSFPLRWVSADVTTIAIHPSRFRCSRSVCSTREQRVYPPSSLTWCNRSLPLRLQMIFQVHPQSSMLTILRGSWHEISSNSKK